MPQPGLPSRHAGLWCVFGAVHTWLIWLGVAVVPAQAFWDLDLYRWWMHRALVQGVWPVLDEASVYPAGAVVPMLLPALGGTTSTAQYALAWCLVVTALDAAALAVLLRLPRGPVAGWWWCGALVLLGPVALGRLDAVITPVTVVALALAAGPALHRPAAALLAAGAWVKVAPGALLLPLAAAARRPWRDVVLPAALVSALVVVVVAVGGGSSRLLSFLTTQAGRGLQVEAVAATPWVLAALGDDPPGTNPVTIRLDEVLITYQVDGPGTASAVRVLDVLLAAGVLTVAAVLLLARRRGRGPQALLPAALLLTSVLVVANKVGSPQYLTWFVPPVAVLLAVAVPDGARRDPGWLRWAAGLVLVASGLTQVVFPWGYPALLAGDPAAAVALALRNATLLAVLGCGVVGLHRAVRGRPDGVAAGPAVRAA